ncbi:ECF transporter S component [Clostridium fungisolvens]|uniref:Riboflavin transporter n=1 Tax=Clostridium fungisolvens TaxID=1604897 RepID=A0A6V8SQ27_9CLOT|nr:ECF transporter S component [Clostridium fungisolvens]GFP77318.1 Riboflavin transporter RibU [Clostridium fungisolvens]
MKQANVTTSKLNVQIKIALLGTIAFLLMFLEFPILPAAPFLKLDLSDLPALLGTFALGPVAGIIIEAIKNILVIVIKGSTSAMIGELANFVIGAVWVIVAGFIYKRNRTIKGAIIGLSLGTIALTIAGLLGNYYVFLPLYNKIVPSLSPEIINYLVTIILPFNLIKGVVVSIVTLVLYKRVSTILFNETALNARKIAN